MESCVGLALSVALSLNGVGQLSVMSQIGHELETTRPPPLSRYDSELRRPQARFAETTALAILGKRAPRLVAKHRDSSDALLGTQERESSQQTISGQSAAFSTHTHTHTLERWVPKSWSVTFGRDARVARESWEESAQRSAKEVDACHVCDEACTIGPPLEKTVSSVLSPAHLALCGECGQLSLSLSLWF